MSTKATLPARLGFGERRAVEGRQRRLGVVGDRKAEPDTTAGPVDDVHHAASGAGTPPPLRPPGRPWTPSAARS